MPKTIKYFYVYRKCVALDFKLNATLLGCKFECDYNDFDNYYYPNQLDINLLILSQCYCCNKIQILQATKLIITNQTILNNKKSKNIQTTTMQQSIIKDLQKDQLENFKLY